jgi:tetratricopeptide (TPR) repeat protein
MADPVRIFISYAREDDALRERLRAHLSQLERDSLVEAWDDREIPAGSEWEDSIDERLENDDVILLLVSADFIRSDFCYGKEMKRAIERHNAKDDGAIVIPVILRKCDWKTAPFGSFQALPRDGKPISEWKTEDDYFEAVATGLRKRIQQLVTRGGAGTSRSTHRPRDPIWWNRPRVRWSVLAAIALVGLSTCWWLSAAAAVDREIDASLTAMREGRYSDAKERLEKTSQRWIVGAPAGPALKKAQLGAMLESEGNALPVEQFADGVVKLRKENPEDPDILLFSGALAWHNKDINSAIEKFQRSLELVPKFPEAHYYWGSMLLSLGDYKGALGHFDAAIELAPHAPHYRNTRAYAKRSMGDIKGAEEDYRQSAADGSILSRLELAELLWLSGNFREAADQQEEALKELRRTSPSSKGRNALPWSFQVESGRTLTLNDVPEKICYAHLAWLASRALMSETMQPEIGDCGPNRSSIARAVAASLARALNHGLPEPAATNAQAFSNALQPDAKISTGGSQ